MSTERFTSHYLLFSLPLFYDTTSTAPLLLHFQKPGRSVCSAFLRRVTLVGVAKTSRSYFFWAAALSSPHHLYLTT